MVITNYKDTYDGGSCPREVEIPAMIGDKNVKYIEGQSFASKELTSVTLPEGLEEIGFNAFWKNKLTSIVIPNSVTKIGDAAFSNMDKIGPGITSVTLGKNVEEIGSQAFYANKITEITIPSKVKIIGTGSFSENEIATLIFSEGSELTTIRFQAFIGNKLSEVNFKEKLVNIGDLAFAYNKPVSDIVTVQGYINKDPSTVTIGTNAGIVLSRSPHNLTFDTNGGSTIAPQIYGKDALIVQPTDPTKDGYTFDGWYKEAGLTNQWNFSTDTMPLNGTTLYAKWVQSSYTVTFKNGYNETPLKTETVAYGANATAPDTPTRAGHTFQGWDLAFTNVISDLTITATWEINTYTVTFNTNGGNTIADQNITHGSPIENVVPSKEGNGFAGWFTDAELTTEWVSTDPVTANMTLYAKWNVNEYTVIFKNGYDETILQSSSVAHGGTVTAPTTPTRVGYTFLGWDHSLENISSALTITATWEINTYTVTFDSDGSTQSVVYQAKIQKPADPSKADYVFKGWYKDAGFTTLRDFATDTMPADHVTLYAKWATAVKISFDTQGGATMADQWIEKSTPLTKPSDPTRAGYTFDGWFTDTELTTAWNFATTIDANTTLYAKWTAKSSSSSSGGGKNNNKPDTINPSDKTPVVVDIDESLKNLLADFTKDADETALQSLTKVLDSIKNSKYDKQLKDAYLYAYLRGITTIDSIEKAELGRGMTRAEMAKMMVMFAKKVLGKEAIKTDMANYKDLKKVDANLLDYIQLAYQLQIMGIDAEGNAMKNFNPHGLVSRAEFATVLSRILFGNKHNQTGTDFYTSHLNALKEHGVLTNTNPKMQELRGWVMLMLMRTESKK